MANFEYYQTSNCRNGRCTGLIMYIEDLVERLVGYGKYLFEPNIIQGTGWEYNFATSVANQISNGNALTEKQATMAVRILKKYQRELEAYFNKPIDLDHPVYRNPFRRITEEKSIKIEKVNDEHYIVVRFPYNQEIIKLFQEYINASDWKSIRWGQVLKQQIGQWNPEIKAWAFSLREENILWLDNNIVRLGFETDETFKEYVKDIRSVLDNIYDHAPCVVKENGEYRYANVSSRVTPFTSDNVLQVLFEAKNAGITAWTEEVDEDLNKCRPSPITSAFLSTPKALFVDNESYGISHFEDIIKYAGPILIIIPGGSETQHTMKWHQQIREWGIPSGKMSVMFRMPNESHGTFNKYVKDNLLNNEITEDTQVVFVSTKIPKPLIKSGLRFNTVLNLGYYRDLHFSMSVLLNSTTNVCYYNNKQPLGVDVVNG